MQKGFSLVELSIVLVILGLLTGGILAGQSLIRAAELRSVTTDYQRHVSAIQSFRDKYMALPGDMPNATRFWNRMNGNADCVTNSSASVISTGVCDGNGNGIMQSPAAASQSGEEFQLWRQLASAGLTEGSYSGVAGAGGAAHSIPATNVPPSKVGQAGFSAAYSLYYGGDAAAYGLDYRGNFLMFGGQNADFRPLNGILRPEEAWNIDTKIDDGRPAYGRVIARHWNNSCATGGASATDLTNSVYNLTSSAQTCAFYFLQAF